MESLNRHEDYGQEVLKETDLKSDPMEQFKTWLKEAEAENIFEPNAFVLSTMSSSLTPSSRTVLLKGIDEHGFYFFTNYGSRKGQELSENPNVSAVFGWYSMYRQVLIEGVAERVPGFDSDEYFASRPHESQVAAWSSHQSKPIENREALDLQFQNALDKFEGGPVPRPDYWGGFLIVPRRIEFWKGRTNRMHDRIAFSRNLVDGHYPQPWSVERLQP
jgi:pyridoxamine 5'-phosphate oxidase